MLRTIRTIWAAVLAGTIIAGSALAQQGLPTFPAFSADDPQRMGIVSRLSVEQRKSLVGYLSEADTNGLFAPELEAGPKDDFGLILYVLSSWEDAKQLPPQILPPVALKQLETIDPSFYRYAIPARRNGDQPLVMIFYVTSRADEKALKCLAEDLVLSMEGGFAPTAVAPCVRENG